MVTIKSISKIKRKGIFSKPNKILENTIIPPQKITFVIKLRVIFLEALSSWSGESVLKKYERNPLIRAVPDKSTILK